jgi:hypothetical protein
VLLLKILTADSRLIATTAKAPSTIPAVIAAANGAPIATAIAAQITAPIADSDPIPASCEYIATPI